MEEYYSTEDVYEDRAEFGHLANMVPVNTCLDIGYAVFECEVCRKTYKITITGAHQYEDGSDVCKNCGQKKPPENTFVSSEVSDADKSPVIAFLLKRKQTLSGFS